MLKESDKKLLDLSKKEKTIMKLRDKNYVRYINMSDKIDQERHDTHISFNKKFDKLFRKIEKKKELKESQD